MIRITLNNEIMELDDDRSLLAVLTKRGFDQAYYAAAVNRHFIPRSLHGETLLKEGDVIEIISPMQGG